MFIRKFKTTFPTYILLILLLWGCTKIDTTNLGENLIPVVDNIHTFDTTLTVVANNFDPPVCDSVYRTDLHALGIIPNDPFFGTTQANIYFELKPLSYPFAFPASDKDSLILDSAVLVMHYSHSYGDTLAPQKVQVYKLLDKFQPDSVYKTYTTCNIFNYDNTELLGEKSFIPARLVDSVHAFREEGANQLRIKLSNSFAGKFISDSATIFKSDTTFTDYFKGFAITVDQLSGGNAINYFNLSNADTRLSFYFRSSVSNVKDTSVVDFTFGNYSSEANSVIHERGNSEITAHLTHPVDGDSVIYIQTAPGSYAEIKIPGLTGMPNRVIHRAELIVDQVSSPDPSDQYLTAPNYLYLDTKDTSTNGTYIPIPCDFTTTTQQPDLSYFGGFKKIVNDGNGNQISQYVFNISRYVQSIVTKGKNNAVLRLRAPYNIINKTGYLDRCNQLISPFNFPLNNISAGRVKLNGTNNSATRMRLHIIYSTL
ncbi:MAG: DUF4270 family protein [Ginsengibacter sp.]